MLAILLAAWAVRLGVLLFRRIHKAGGDRRFDEIIPYHSGAVHQIRAVGAVFLLLTEARSDERGRGQPDYQAYKEGTPVRFPRPPRG